MANKKFTDLDPASSLTGTDLLAVTLDPSGTPISRKASITQLMGQAPVQSVAGRTGVVTLSNTDISGLGTAATTASTDYATAAQGTTADSAVQPTDSINVLSDVDTSTVAPTNGQALVWDNTAGQWEPGAAGASNLNALSDVSINNPADGSILKYVTANSQYEEASLGTAATANTSDFATSAQGALADTAVQPTDNISTLTNDSGFITGLSAGALSDFDFDDNAILGFKASLPTEITAATYSVADADNGKVIRVNHASGCTVTIPSGLLTTDSSGFNCSFVQVGAGAITFANDGTSAVNNRQSHTKTNGQWAVASVVSTSNNVFVLAGDTTA